MDQSTVILLELGISTRTIRAILAEVHVCHNPVMGPVLHLLWNRPTGSFQHIYLKVLGAMTIPQTLTTASLLDLGYV
jgi:hypothetical protein